MGRERIPTFGGGHLGGEVLHRVHDTDPDDPNDPKDSNTTGSSWTPLEVGGSKETLRWR